MAAILDISERLKRHAKATAANGDEEHVGVQQQKNVTFSPNVQYLHGPNQLLSFPGLDPDIFSVIQRPRGLARILPIRASRYEQPLFDVITSQTRPEGAPPADPCSAPPPPGMLREEAIRAPFGLLRLRTDTIDAVSLGRLKNRGEPMDLRLVNQLVASSPFVPDPCRDPNFVQSEIGFKMFMLGLEIERALERMVFTGNGAMAGNGYGQFRGLEMLVNTGLIGEISGALVPALDSTVVNWSNSLFSATRVVNGRSVNMVELLSSLLFFMESRAEDTGLAPVQYVLVMPRDLFWELSAVWPCQYLTTGCETSGNTDKELIIATGAEQVNTRDDYRNRNYLMINGKPYPVITSEGMTQNATANGVGTDIYLLPLSAAGMQTLYLEHFDFNNPELAAAASGMGPAQISSSNNGMFVWTYERSELCWWYSATVRPRIVLRTPWLAARIRNVVYKPVYHTYDGFLDGLYPPPGGGLYRKDWGIYP